MTKIEKKKCIPFRHAYSGQRRSTFETSGDSIVQQNLRDECDVNNIVKRYAKTGVLTHINSKTPRYGDFSQVTTYQDACNLVIQAQESFQDLPSDVRRHFDNDPTNLINALNDPSRASELQSLGILESPDSTDRSMDVESVDSNQPSSSKADANSNSKNEQLVQNLDT
jgi:phage internal scaffolding protein